MIIAPGTVGQGDQCAPSHAFSTGLNVTTAPFSLSANQEALSANVWSAMGARVFVTDYIGLGTPGVHTYVNRLEEAHAVLDAARAANALGGSGPTTPLAPWGYSTISNHFGPELIDGYDTNGAVSYIVDRMNDSPIAEGCRVN